jgi:hypothetical protein
MTGLDRRLRHLEACSGINQPGLSVVIRTGVPRATDGPEGPGPVCAIIVSGPNKGMWITRGEGEPEAAFIGRVDQTERGYLDRH